nr:hypothetical protein [Tanacetum cinerariifolium]
MTELGWSGNRSPPVSERAFSSRSCLTNAAETATFGCSSVVGANAFFAVVWAATYAAKSCVFCDFFNPSPSDLMKVFAGKVYELAQELSDFWSDNHGLEKCYLKLLEPG